jgi:hypothetical protein
MLNVVVHLVTTELERLTKCPKFEVSTEVDVKITGS